MPELLLTDEQAKELSRVVTGLARDTEESKTKLGKVADAVVEMAGKFDDTTARLDRIERAKGASGLIVSAGFKSAFLSAAATALPKELRGGMYLVVKMATKDVLGIASQWPEQLQQVARTPTPFLGARFLIPAVPTSRDAITFLRRTSTTNNAAAVAEGAPKPKGAKTYDVVKMDVHKIAEYDKLSTETYNDMPALTADLEIGVIADVNVTVEMELVKGTGISPHLSGLYPAAPVATALTGSGVTMIDAVYAAAGELAAAGYQPNGVLMNHSDLIGMQSLKDTTGRYLFSSAPSLPQMATSPALAVGEWIVGDFRYATQHVREETTVTIATQNEDDFIKNLMTVLAECRLTLAIKQSAAFRKNPAVTP